MRSSLNVFQASLSLPSPFCPLCFGQSLRSTEEKLEFPPRKKTLRKRIRKSQKKQKTQNSKKKIKILKTQKKLKTKKSKKFQKTFPARCLSKTSKEQKTPKKS